MSTRSFSCSLAFGDPLAFGGSLVFGDSLVFGGPLAFIGSLAFGDSLAFGGSLVFGCSLDPNLSKVPWSFDAKAALTPPRVAFASGEVFATCSCTCFKVDTVVFFIALEIPRATPPPTVPVSCFKRRPSWT